MQPAFGGVARRLAVLGPPRPVRRRVGGAAPDLPALASTVASYCGHLRHGSAWTDWLAIRSRWPWLRFLFRFDGWQARARWRASPFADGAPLPPHGPGGGR